MKFRKLWLWAAAVAVLAVSVASAAAIPVNNFSFENAPGGFANAPLPLTGCGTGCSYSNDAVIPGWTATSGGLFEPGPGFPGGTTAYFNSIPDGVTIAYSNGGTITQNVGSVTGAGLLYTLMVDIGLRKDLPNGPLGTAQLLIGSTVVNATGVTPAPGSFATFTATYLSTPANVGQAIAIQLTSTGSQGDFDNVRLDASATVPEPATAALFGLGFATFGLIARRTRRK
jgi:hypothetical protein